MGTVTFSVKDGQGNVTATTVTVTVAGRVGYLWPGSVASPWNTPIGSAVYDPTQFWPLNGTRDNFFAETEVCGTSPTAPLIDVWQYNKGSYWANPYQDPAPVKLTYQVRANTGYRTQQSDPSWDQTTPNAAGGLLLADGVTVQEFNYGFVRLNGTNPKVDPSTVAFLGSPRGKFRLDGDGVPTTTNKGGHGGSMLPGFFGSIRLGELWGTADIRHCVKLNGWMRGFGLRNAAGKNQFVWPAVAADASDQYGTQAAVVPGCVSLLPMGALIAIPYTTDLTKVTFETDVAGNGPARKLAYALQRFGCYLVDEVGDQTWVSNGWGMEWGCVEEALTHGVNVGGRKTGAYPNPWSRDSDKLLSLCRWVKNNSATTIGGGGTPLYPPAPALST